MYKFSANDNHAATNVDVSTVLCCLQRDAYNYSGVAPQIASVVELKY